jgi:hypothetical protein
MANSTSAAIDASDDAGVQYLIRSGADVNLTAPQTLSMSYSYTASNTPEKIKQQTVHFKPLQIACFLSPPRATMVVALLKAGAELTAAGNTLSPLHLAVREHSTEVTSCSWAS